MDSYPSKIRIGLNGANGRMCRAIKDEISQNSKYIIAFGIDKTPSQNPDFPIFKEFNDSLTCDVLIDFSYHTATMPALDFAVEKRIPILVATTGHTEEEKARILKAGEDIPVFFESNTSLGVYLTILLAKTAAEFLDESFDVEIVETHHRGKADSPSGTALAIADAIRNVKASKGKRCTLVTSRSKERVAGEITLHSLRGGTVVGKHEIHFLGDDERLTVIHEAENKSIYVHGALRAVDFLTHAKKGVYGMQDVVR